MKRLFALFFVSVVLVGCSKGLDESQWDTIGVDMSISSIEQSLGSPKNTITDREEMLDEVNVKVNAAKDLMKSSIFAESESLNQAKSKLEDFHRSIKNGEDVKIIQYEVKGENKDGEKYSSLRSIYLYGDRVVYYQGAQ